MARQPTELYNNRAGDTIYLGGSVCFGRILAYKTIKPAIPGRSGFSFDLVSGAGLEPAREYPYAPQTYASANSAIPTRLWVG